jgi:hypothetical protein
MPFNLKNSSAVVLSITIYTLNNDSRKNITNRARILINARTVYTINLKTVLPHPSP